LTNVVSNPTTASHWGGILRITIHQAKELDEKKSMVGQLNPFVELKQNQNLIYKSKIKKRTNNPSWGELIELFIRQPEFEKIRFTVKDNRDLSVPLELGYCEISVKEIVSMIGGQIRPTATGKSTR
jgi:Ca2+-dependent lipid-binding protein